MSRARDANYRWMDGEDEKKVAEPVKIQKKKIYNLVTSQQMVVVAAHVTKCEREISRRDRIAEGRSTWGRKNHLHTRMASAN